MSGRIYVHIGLPKTATTTLQTEVFPGLSGNGVSYVGVYQPRGEGRQQGLYWDIYRAVDAGNSIDSVREKLRSILESGTTVIISEEGLTVSGAVTSWRDKLRNLHTLITDLDYALILTVREPSSALFSYYVELYDRFAGRFPSFVECALHDEAMHIYHYKKLTDEVFSRFERERVYAFRFEDIIENGASGLVDLISPSSGWAQQTRLGNHGQRRYAKGFVRTRYGVTARDVIRGVVKRHGINGTKVYAGLRKLAQPMIRRLDKLILKNTKVAIPSQEEMSHLKNALREETAALHKHFQIKYE